jgi:hypothetical protein
MKFIFYFIDHSIMNNQDLPTSFFLYIFIKYLFQNQFGHFLKQQKFLNSFLK